MNREIKFRVWLPTIKKMSHGVSLLDWIRDSAHLELRAEDIFLQYTGLKDKNGKEIYEGDVVNCIDHPTEMGNATGSVYWHEGRWRVTWSMIALGDYGTAWTEVIGNIYEHPHLLNNEQEDEVSDTTKLPNEQNAENKEQ